MWCSVACRCQRQADNASSDLPQQSMFAILLCRSRPSIADVSGLLKIASTCCPCLAGCREQRRTRALVRSGQGLRVCVQARARCAGSRCVGIQWRSVLHPACPDSSLPAVKVANLPSCVLQAESAKTLGGLSLLLTTSCDAAQASPWQTRGSRLRRRSNTARVAVQSPTTQRDEASGTEQARH